MLAAIEASKTAVNGEPIEIAAPENNDPTFGWCRF
jgi:hypothetical protein